MGAVTLDLAPLGGHAGLTRIGELLGADGARLVGGVVRDSLLGLPVHDLDIATRHDPDSVMARLRAGGVRVVPTGIAHGTVTAVFADGPIEITTLRRDLTTDGRHATIAFTDDWREDAARRDFTINALYAQLGDGTVHDYFGGLDDLATRRVRFIGDPLARIAEDHLRILRFFRFTARFADMPDGDSLDACAARANDLMALSRERIADELLRLLVAARAPETVALMLARGILAPVLPEVRDGARLARLAAREAAATLAPAALRRLAALLPNDPALGDAIGARLRLSNAQRRRLASALDPVLDAPRALAYRLGVEGAIDRFALHAPEGEALAAIATLAGHNPARLPLTGGALIARGLSKGPDVARALRRIEDRWVAEDFPGANRLEAIVAEEVAQVLRSISQA